MQKNVERCCPCLAPVRSRPWPDRLGQGPAWPTRHLRFISGGAAGGTSDIVARNLQEPLQSKFGQSVVIENMPGSAA